MWLIVLIIAVILLIAYLRIRKIPKYGNMVLVTGGIKTGKSTLSVYMVSRALKRQRIKYYIKCFFLRVFKFLRIKKFLNKPFPEKPILYSNIPLNIPYSPLTHDLIMRRTRFIYGSVVYVCESSLVADSMSFKDDNVNENMLLLNKLFAHETRGGIIFYDTQSVSDNHYAIRRCLNTYLNVHHTFKYLPFFLLMWVREERYSEDGQTVNTYNEDVEETLKLVIVPKSTWKKFDCYCYSAFTDDLPVSSNVVNRPPTLKAQRIVTFKTYRNLYSGGKKK